jgi:hypothetical protein
MTPAELELELAAARERYRKHLAADLDESPVGSPYWTGNVPAWNEELYSADLELLARSACDGDGDAADAERYQWLKSASGIWWDNNGFIAQMEGRLDAAIDAARKGVGG